MSEQAICKKRGKTWVGTLTGTTFKPLKEWESDKPNDYIRLHDFLLLTNPKQTKKQSEESRKEIGWTEVYIYVADNGDYWAYTNHKCNTCTKKCKQSSKVEILTCPQYEEIK